MDQAAIRGLPSYRPMSGRKPTSDVGVPGDAAQLQRRRRLAEFIAGLLENPRASRYWAEHCGWLPGTGRCRTRSGIKCRPACPFGALRQREADLLCQQRRRRRQTLRLRS